MLKSREQTGLEVEILDLVSVLVSRVWCRSQSWSREFDRGLLTSLLPRRLQRSVAENDDLLERLAEMKRDRWRRERQIDEQMRQVADRLSNDNPQPNSDRSPETAERLEGRRNVERLRRDLDDERRRYAELERTYEQLQSRLEHVQIQSLQSAPETADVEVQANDTQLGDQLHLLTTQLAAARQQLIDQAGSSNQVKRLLREKAKIEEKNSELSSAVAHLKRKNATSEEQEGMLRIQLDKLKRTMDACGTTDDDLEKRLQHIFDKNHELEQQLERMRTEQKDAQRTEKMLNSELEKLKQTENERAASETKLKMQLTKARDDYNTLSQKMLSEIDRLEEKSKRMNEEVSKLKEVNRQLANSERQLQTELIEVKSEASENLHQIGQLQHEIYTLQTDLQTREQAYIKLCKDSDELLAKMVPKERLEEVETELKQAKKAAEDMQTRLKKLENEQYSLQGKAEVKEQKVKEELDKVRSQLTTKEKQLQKAAEKSLELQTKNEKLKQSYSIKEKQFKSTHEHLEKAAKEQHDTFQEKLKTQETQHLVEKEHMLTMWNEKEKELKNKIKMSKLEIKTEVDKVKSKCEQIETAHEENTRQKEEETKRRIYKMKDEIEERSKLMQAANEKNEELQKVIDKHVSQASELESLRLANDEMKEKVGKLERAVLRLRLENDELRENKVYRNRDGHVRDGEQAIHISDVQLDMLRRALKDPSKVSPRISVEASTDAARSPAGVDRLLAELLQLLKTSAEASQRPVEDSSTLARELEAERRKVRAGSERIAQLERWLDTIFNDQQFGIGPATESQVTLPPVDGVWIAAPADNSKKHATTINQSPNKQKQTRTARPKRK